MTPQALISSAVFTVSAILLYREIFTARQLSNTPDTKQLQSYKTSTEDQPAAQTLPVEKLTVRDLLWTGLFALIDTIIAVCVLIWPYNDSVVTAAMSAYCLWFFGHATLRRHLIADQLFSLQQARETKRSKKARLSLRAKLFLIICLCTVFGLEMGWNTYFPFVLPHAFVLELLIVGLVLRLIYHLFLRSGAALAVGVISFTSIGMIQGFVLSFKGAVLSVGDLYAAGTAAAVSGGYNFRLEAPMLSSFIAAALGLFCCSLLADQHFQTQPKPKLSHQILRSEGRAAITAALLGFMLLVPNYQTQLAIKVDYWWEWQLIDHKLYCFVPSFVAEAQDLPIKVPHGYSRGLASDAEKSLVARYKKAAGKDPGMKKLHKQFREEKPTIIVVMNETFTDLSLFGDFGGYTGPEFFKQGINDTLSRGKLAVSVNGGGTCNTEFEFLTGQSMAFVGRNKYPYTLYNFGHVPTLPRQLAAQGYRCYAMHPNLATNWDRDRTYKDMGFERFYDINDFEGAKLYHNAVSDEACYDKIFDLLNSTDQPQFIFTVTMQNHSGYDQGGIPDTDMAPYANLGNAQLDDQTNGLIREYLACIGESDRALKEFVGKLRQIDKPVLLVFFGDHQPYFSNVINDAQYQNEDTVTHEERLYQSDYLIWTNYKLAADIQGRYQNVASASDLAAQSLECIGAPLTRAQQARLGARSDISELNLFGFRDRGGRWRSLDDDTGDKATMTLQELRYLAYRDFGSRV